ncbi:ATP-sensitive inward rectifier potassium channel 10 [Trichocoleus sp. FACHB-90]|uniref:ion channel n=1 Tax=Cyanophyceae TaxID=3028117 RepID=UPI00168601D3|nr:ion channel [Trichocoleus sp. FACHB-90]MBD1926210.1 ATP-sensitive inward rectifier potassium channel 10 [Trichocoleus sp. FACHB-90]
MAKRQRPSSSKRFLSTNRQFNVVGRGNSRFYWGDLYYLILTISWPWFFVLLALGYAIANSLFAIAYLAGGDGIENAQPGSFKDAFFFSVQTMASIGYGAMYPRTLYVNFLVTIESLVGLLGIAMGSGLMFARFSRPTARVLFSRVAVISRYDGVPTLMFRAANQRRNFIVEAQINVTMVRNEINREGEFMRRFYDLKLVRSHTPIFALSWTVMHPIDETSPLYGATLETLAQTETDIVITLIGLDETVSQNIHARHSFSDKEILWNMRFVDIFTSDRRQDGRRLIDYTRFHDVVPEGLGTAD